ncbi:hypothetical protein [Microvirga massiliensis]|uniref:hypothetical protein n=1 Tax=Microvirga massiliensis TaxID=1033741 RepID=UPI00062BCA67|nr:hypothetical protein [Microvirga massiliensis]
MRVQIKVIEVDEKTLAISFPYVATLVAQVKQLPGAKFDGSRRAWLVSKRYRKRVDAWLEQLRETEKEEAEREREALKQAIAHANALFDALHERGEKMSTPHVAVMRPRFDGLMMVRCEYQEEAVAILKSLGAHWSKDDRRWEIPATQVEALHAAMPDLERLVAAVVEAHEQEKREREEEQRQRRIERDRRRYLIPLRWTTELGTGHPVRFPQGGAPVVIEGYGKAFRCSDDAPSLWGSHLLGHEGEMVCYAYHRPATDDEVSALEQREMAEKARATLRAAARKAEQELVERIRSEGEYPSKGTRYPQGEILYAHRPDLRIYGGGHEWMLSGQTLWYLEGHGGDGDDWSANNLPSTRAWRMPAEPETITALRHIADVLK